MKGPNGQSIFLPAAGAQWNEKCDEAGAYGSYWSSSYRDSDCPFHLKLSLPYVYIDVDIRVAYAGMSIRPVCL